MRCLKRIGSEGAFEPVPSTCAATVLCVEVLTVQCLFPAFLFFTHFDPTLYKATMRKSVEPKVASFWEGIRGTYREHILRANPFFYSGTPAAEVPDGKLSLTALSKLKEVGREVDKAFAVLESLRKATVSASVTTDDMFFLGTSRPTYVDALVYAAASSFVHADLSEASAGVRVHQRRVQDACPALLEYVERVHHQFFEADSGAYCLKPREAAAEADPNVVVAKEVEQQYRSGRLQTLWWTGVFASVYFFLVNADMLVALLERAEEAEEAAAMEVAAADEANQQSSTSSSSDRLHEPQGLQL
ncbi:Glutathione S-transferase, C-terminal domain containing protein, putative [Leishmania lindenbergi]|uniref:Glutathione S-transferase, C-terminal domain containing protein n=1 Tax=Leishmania lindenbergi TaxID=651832 RepID=A0AAW3AEV5_9TRYP